MPTIQVVKIADDTFVGSVTLANIRANLLDPRRVERSTIAQRNSDSDLRRAFDHRVDGQRKFDKPRTQRAIDYAHYIAGLRSGKPGGVPPITLWTTAKGTFMPVNNSTIGELIIAGQTVLTAADGETQLAARYMLIEGFDDEEFEHLLQADDTWYDEPFAITIRTNWTKEEAMQTLHDVNTYGTPVKEVETAPLNKTGALTKAIDTGIEASQLDPSLIKSRGEIGARSKEATTMLILLYGAIGVVHGMKAIHESSPRKWITDGNKQFADLGGKEASVSAFVDHVLSLPYTDLRKIGTDQMLAMGVHYARTGTILPIPAGVYSAIVGKLRVQHKRLHPNTIAAGLVANMSTKRPAPAAVAASVL